MSESKIPTSTLAAAPLLQELGLIAWCAGLCAVLTLLLHVGAPSFPGSEGREAPHVHPPAISKAQLEQPQPMGQIPWRP